MFPFAGVGSLPNGGVRDLCGINTEVGVDRESRLLAGVT
jgi:hypothetical protein